MRTMKKCTKCLRKKSEDSFSFKNRIKGTRQSVCKGCHSRFLKSYYKTNKQAHLDRNKVSYGKRLQYVRDLKESNPCMDCRKKYPHFIMEFDHRDEKAFNVSSLIGWGWKMILAEIEKCDVVCANCHAERTWNRRNMAG